MYLAFLKKEREQFSHFIGHTPRIKSEWKWNLKSWMTINNHKHSFIEITERGIICRFKIRATTVGCWNAISVLSLRRQLLRFFGGDRFDKVAWFKNKIKSLKICQRKVTHAPQQNYTKATYSYLIIRNNNINLVYQSIGTFWKLLTFILIQSCCILTLLFLYAHLMLYFTQWCPERHESI